MIGHREYIMCALGKGWQDSEQGRKRGIEENRGLIKSTVGAKRHGKKLFEKSFEKSIKAWLH